MKQVGANYPKCKYSDANFTAFSSACVIKPWLLTQLFMAAVFSVLGIKPRAFHTRHVLQHYAVPQLSIIYLAKYSSFS